MRLPALVAVALLAVPAAAIGQGGSRQNAALVFDEQRPGQSSGSRFAIDYFNPDDAAAKPPAVAKVVIKLNPGSAIDTSVPARCEASDQELMAGGASVCPAGSRVGTGELDVDSGTP